MDSTTISGAARSPGRGEPTGISAPDPGLKPRPSPIPEARADRAPLSLDEVCLRYWQPLRASLLHRGLSPEDVEDLTQEFFLRLIEKNWLAPYDPARGQLGSFLLVLLKRFQTNAWHKQHCQKRGGGQTPIPLDALEPAQRAAVEPTDPATPATLYDADRAAAALVRALAQLRAEALAHGTADRFDLLEPTLFGEKTALCYAELAQHLGTTETAVKSLIHRLRGRFRALLHIDFHSRSEVFYYTERQFLCDLSADIIK